MKNNSFVNFFKMLFVPGDPKSVQKRKLKKIAKQISRSRFGKWYKSNAKELTPACGQFFFDVYKTVGPAQALLESASSSEILKNITVEENMTKDQKLILEKLSREAILERAKEVNYDTLAKEVGQVGKDFFRSFSKQQEDLIDAMYQQLDGFVQFVLYDYYFLLKKFDLNLQENNFKYVPHFQNARGEYVCEALKDFVTVFYTFPFNANWNSIFTIITKYKGVKPVNPSVWKKLLSVMIDVRRSDVLESIIKHIDEHPEFRATTNYSTDGVTSDYIGKILKSAENTLKEISKVLQKNQITSLVEHIFQTTTPLSGTKYYISEFSESFEKKGFDGFMYADALSYLKSFLIEYFKTEIRGLSDLFLVRATWENPQLVKEYSESYHDLLKIAEKIAQFDEKLKQGDPLSMKLKACLARTDRDRSATSFLYRQLEEINDEAYKIIVVATKHIIVIANNFKAIIDDYDKPHRTLIQNWKEIELNSANPPRQWLADAYKRIHSFVRLMQLYVSKK